MCTTKGAIGQLKCINQHILGKDDKKEQFGCSYSQKYVKWTNKRSKNQAIEMSHVITEHK